MCGSMVDIQSAADEIRRGKKIERSDTKMTDIKSCRHAESHIKAEVRATCSDGN